MDSIPRQRIRKFTYDPHSGTPEQKRRALDRQRFTKLFFDHMTATEQIDCAVCGWAPPEAIRTLAAYPNLCRILEVHHIIPVCAGGLDTFDNAVLLCPNHHRIADVLTGITCIGGRHAAGITDRETLLQMLNDLDEDPVACARKTQLQREQQQADVTNLLSELLDG